MAAKVTARVDLEKGFVTFDFEHCVMVGCRHYDASPPFEHLRGPRRLC